MSGWSAAEGCADPVDRTQLDRLLEEVGAQTLSRYVASYLELLPERMAGLERAVAVGAGSQALRIMADLRTSSTMLGARRLATLVAVAQMELRALPARRWESAVRALPGEARAVDGALRSALVELSGREKGPSGHPRSDSPGPPKR